MPLQQVQEIGAFASKYQPRQFEGGSGDWRGWARDFLGWSGPCFWWCAGRNRFATFPTDPYHVLIMLTRGRAQWLVLKAAEPEGLEVHRFLLRRYEPVSTVSKLVELLATTFNGDLKDYLTDFERRVTSLEHEAKETLSDLINIGVVIKGLEKSGFRYHLLIKTAGTTEWTKLVKEIENVASARRSTQLVPMDFLALGSQDRQFQRRMCGLMARDCRKETEYLQNNLVCTGDKSKGKPGTGKGKGK